MFLGGNETNDVFVQTGRYSIGFNVGDESGGILAFD